MEKLISNHYKIMEKQQFTEITNWQKEKFGDATPLSKIAHLAEEVIELYEAINNKEPEQNIRMEFADCIMLLFGAAKAHGLSYEDICEAIAQKYEINKSRKWGEPDENGVVKHIN